MAAPLNHTVSNPAPPPEPSPYPTPAPVEHHEQVYLDVNRDIPWVKDAQHPNVEIRDPQLIEFADGERMADAADMEYWRKHGPVLFKFPNVTDTQRAHNAAAYVNRDLIPNAPCYKNGLG